MGTHRIYHIIKRHVGAESVAQMLKELAKVDGSRSFADTIKELRRIHTAPPEARGKFIAHRNHAHGRNVTFTLTFDEWWSIWEQSGKWEKRGNRSEQYCMCRKHDSGGYSVGNVRIRTNRQNCSERWNSLEHRAAVAASNRRRAGKALKPEHRAAISAGVRRHLAAARL
jgi:hypothetical protein